MPSHILPITNNSPIPSQKLKDSVIDFDHDDSNNNQSTRILISSSFDDKIDNDSENALASKPLLSRANSFTSIAVPNCYQQRRRRVHSDNSLLSLNGCSGRDRWFGGHDGVGVDERFIVTRWGLKVWRYVGLPVPLQLVGRDTTIRRGPVREGCKWVMRFLALGCYSLLIMPGLFQVAYNYYFSRQIRRDIIYGNQRRNKLDLYLPKNSDGPKPVVAFITGGAWIIGYKAWGSLLGQQLSERDVIVACIDYRNFPQGTIGDMVKDASRGISFVCNNIAEYGGDPNRIYLMGQSAGAHIAACALVEQAIKEAAKGETLSWSVSQIKTYFGLSGGYDLLSLYSHFHNRGLHRSIFLSIMEGEESLQRYSPDLMIKDPNTINAVSLLPPIVLFHGSADYSIPSDSSTKFADSLKALGVKAESILYEGKTHTDVFVQDPMRGGRDQLFEDVVTIIHADDPEALAKDEVAPPRRRLVPEFMLKLASRISPF